MVITHMSAIEKRAASRKPPIHISEEDYDRIAGMAIGIESSSPQLAKMLLDEIDRAKVHPARTLPRGVVSIGSEVEFIDDSSGQRRRVKLVFPQDADLEEGRISIMTPVGAGLIGMSAGREISWPRPDGSPRVLKIIDVKQPS